jgi:hypothetical protein
MALEGNIGNKHPGDPIKSDDWNELAAEAQRLGTDKLDLTGGTISGPLAVKGPVSSPALGVEILHGTEDTWGITVDNVNYVPVIERDVTFDSAASLLVVGHCSAITNPDTGVQMVLSVDRKQLHQVNANSAISWGMATHWGNNRGEVSSPLVTMGIYSVDAGTHHFQLLARSTTPGQSVGLNGPTLFILRVGAG